jgi:hypothetical protein
MGGGSVGSDGGAAALKKGEMSRSDEASVHRREDEVLEGPITILTPTSGLNLIDDIEVSEVPETQLPTNMGDRDKVIEAAKLLQIQKQVRFTFAVPEEETLKQLIEEEVSDRAKKMKWEQRICDQ